ncbi:MAG: MTH1187 family thiamine-binding protein [Euryarchaeota archaeon]|nr:MTH1187 family thiamine-binding protein [Euryarchaeota archaeon]
MLIAFSVVPLGVGTSVGKYVQKIIEELKKRGFKFQVGPMFTTVELDPKDLMKFFEFLRDVHEMLASQGIGRIETMIKIDDRRDKPETIEYKVKRALGEI